jgi:vancomycin resistance protein YoaR
MTTDTPPMPETGLPREQSAPLFAFDPEDLPIATPRRRGRGLRRFFVAFLAALITVMAIGAGGLYAYDRQFEGRIAAGVRVGAVDLSGLTPAAATERLNGAYAAASQGELVLHTPAGQTSISYADIGRHVDVDQLVADAMAFGQTESPLERAIGRAKIALRGVTLTPRIMFNADALAARIEAVAASEDHDAKNASVKRSKAGFQLIKGDDGRLADRSTPYSQAVDLLTPLDAASRIDVDVPVTSQDPAITTAEASSARHIAQAMARDVVLVVGNETWTIKPSVVRSWMTFAPTPTGLYAPKVDRLLVRKVIKGLAREVDRAPINASFLVSNSNKVVGVTASKDGRALDVTKTTSGVMNALKARAAGAKPSDVTATVAVTKPELTTREARKTAPLMQLISHHTTWFPYGIRNNFGANIWLPAQFIDGTVVAPGETFDFWQAVGPVTRERGFGLGGAIIDGHTEPQGALAGGICSNSTTLFNAAMKAGMHMLDRKNHFYYIDRYPTGLDATVFKSGSSTQTMSFINDTKYPILIRGIRWRVGSKGYVRYDIYSVPNGRSVDIGPATVKNYRPATTVYQYTSSLKKGVREQIEFPVAGRDVWRTVTVKDARTGKVIDRRTYYSHYSRITGIILVGTG